MLKTFKALFSFALDQRIFVPLPRFMPAPRNQGGICADIFGALADEIPTTASAATAIAVKLPHRKRLMMQC